MNNRISKEKRALIIATLAEGTPINAVCRIFKTGKHAVLRIIAETGEALACYMDKNFRDLSCGRVAMDESWSYVHTHGARMEGYVEGRGDYWLWAAIDSDTKLVFSHLIDRRNTGAAASFVGDVAGRVVGPVQLMSDPLSIYRRPVRNNFEAGTFSYGTETKIFHDADNP